MTATYAPFDHFRVSRMRLTRRKSPMIADGDFQGDTAALATAFVRLCRQEPRLAVLAVELACQEFTPGTTRRKWYTDGVKEQVVRLVGWNRRPPGFVKPRLPEPAGRFITSAELAARSDASDMAVQDALAALPDSDAARERYLMSSAAYDTAYDFLEQLCHIQHGE